MDEAVLAHADVDEGAEGRDIRDDPRTDHARLQVLDPREVLAEGEGLPGTARIGSGTLDLGGDIGRGLRAQLPAQRLAGVAAQTLRRGRAAAEQDFERCAVGGRERLQRRLPLGMDARRVERRVAADHPDEAGDLLPCARVEPRRLDELASRAERTASRTELDDRLGENRPDPRDARQQLGRARIQVDPDAVHATLDDFVELLFQAMGRYVVMVLPRPHGLRVDLDDLGERILQSSRDRDCAARPGIEVRHLRTRGLAAGPGTDAGLVHQDHRHGATALGEHLAHVGLDVAATRPVADRHREHAVLAHRLGQRLGGSGDLLVALGVEGEVGERSSVGTDHDGLAAAARVRINADHRTRTEGRREEGAPDVLREDVDRDVVRDRAQRLVDLGLDHGAHLLAQGGDRGAAQEGGPGRIGDRAGMGLEGGDQPRLELRVVRRTLDRAGQFLLGDAATDRQVAVRVLPAQQRGDRLGPLEVLRVAAVLLGALAAPGEDGALLAQRTAHERPQVGDLRDALDEDVARAADRRLGIGHALLLVAEGEGP